MPVLASNFKLKPASRWLLRLLLIGLSLIVGGTASHAQGETKGYLLRSYEVADGCASSDFFGGLMDQALGDHLGSEAVHIDVDLRIEKKRKRYHLRLETTTAEGSGVRLLRDKNCDELIATAAAIVSLALEPMLLYENERPAPQPAPPQQQRQAHDQEVPGLPSRRSDSAISLRSERSSSVRLHVGFNALTEAGSLPRPAVGLAFAVAVQSPQYRLEVSLTRWAPQQEEVAVGDKGGRFDFVSGSLKLCRHLWPARITGGACLSTSVGRLNAEAVNILEPIDQAHIMATLGGGLYFQIPLGAQWQLRFDGDVGAQLIRPRYTIEITPDSSRPDVVQAQVHQPAILSARLGAGLQRSF